MACDVTIYKYTLPATGLGTAHHISLDLLLGLMYMRSSKCSEQTRIDILFVITLL